MDSNLVDIKDRLPNDDTVDQLERLLAKAKTGKLRSIVTIAGWDDDCVSHGWSLDDRNSRRRLLAELLMLQHDFVVNIELNERDSVLSRAFDVD